MASVRTSILRETSTPTRPPTRSTRYTLVREEPENRMRFLTQIYRAMRDALGDDFPIGLKLNSSDGVEGGFSEQDALSVIETMAAMGLDLVEISGGTYTKPPVDVVDGVDPRRGTIFFLDFARRLQGRVDIPVALTGGFLAAPDMEEVLASGAADMIGIGRGLVVSPDLPNKILDGGSHETVSLPRVTTPVSAVDRALGSILVISWYEHQLCRLAEGKQVASSGDATVALMSTLRSHGLGALAPRRNSGRK